MTFFELYKAEGHASPGCKDATGIGCPHDFPSKRGGHLHRESFCERWFESTICPTWESYPKADPGCFECWNREVPERTLEFLGYIPEREVPEKDLNEILFS